MSPETAHIPAELRCRVCGLAHSPEKPWLRCRACGGMLEFELRGRLTILKGLNSMWRYRSVLPIPRSWTPVSLVEGFTPLVEAGNLAGRLGLKRLYLKDDSRNPTGSFRDRGASLMVTWAYRLGFKTVVAASNGNMGVSLAAYTGKVGLGCRVVTPRNVDEGKVLQLLVYGSDVEEYGLYLDDAIERASKLSLSEGVYQATPELNPLAVEAQKTIAYEVWERLSREPDVVVAPVGSGSCLYSLWKGFTELKVMGLADGVPRFIAVQAEGCAPIVEAFKGGVWLRKPKPQTKATAILVRSPIYGDRVVEVLKATGGSAVAVSDEEMFKAEREVARLEGLFVEPSSSSTVAVIPRLLEEGLIKPEELVVCILTGSGLKAPSISEFLSVRRRAVEVPRETSMKMRVLTVLSRGERHGYAVWRLLKKAVSLQAVYQHLKDLERRGYVESTRLNGRRVYRLTEEGRLLLKAFRIIRGR